MTSELFRKEAVDHATRRLCGEVMLAVPLKVTWIGVLLVGFIASALVFAGTASYARKETVVGWLTPESGLVRIAAQQGGIALSLAVEEGQTVAAGAKIAVLRLSADTRSGNAGDALLRAMTAQNDAAESRARSALSSLEAEERRLGDERLGLASELSALAEQIVFQAQRVDLSAAETERGRAMAERGVLPATEFDRRHAQELAARQDLAALRRAKSALEREIGGIAARLSALPIDRAAAQADAAAARAVLAERRTEMQVANEYVVTSPVAGRIAAVPVLPGQALAPGAVLAVVTPAHGRLMAELYIPSRAAGFVRRAQDVRLMYEAFPHQRFGLGAGKVEAVSRTMLAPSEVAIPGVTLQEPVFRVRAALARDSIDAYGEAIPLQPGMLLRADVIIDRRSLLEWLFDPILAVRQH